MKRNVASAQPGSTGNRNWLPLSSLLIHLEDSALARNRQGHRKSSGEPWL
ncbi:hypothetical protein [Brevibacillus brevis]|uniref:Uncharacterized protein n=1 Tax=Brevibacillus brevis TaxID=1393 RepID=A0ABY9SZT5_BREBE|nr:hypothetical protein [Brevibacillus brevis]WNC13241.1 hypothetical protein RGB73_21425 [Brevibacillus brevis]